MTENRADHPNRQVGRERWIPNYDPHEEEREAARAEGEPDFEAIMEARHERRRPDWA